MTVLAQEKGKRSIFFTCQGTRGDVQPYCHLGQMLQKNGWSVALGAPPEFERFVEKSGLQFVDIGESPTHEMYSKSVSGDSANPLTVYRAVNKFFNPSHGEPFTTEWFRRILRACRDLKPDILVLVFTAWCGAAVIPELLGLKTKVVISYPMPMAPSREFAVSMAGAGYSMTFSFLNVLQWRFSERFIVQKIHWKAAKRTLEIIKQEEHDAGRPLPGARSVSVDKTLNTSHLTFIFAFSPSILPKPLDWPAEYHVVGPLQRAHSSEEYSPLPGHLQEYLDKCRLANLHVIYIGFGSLGFFEENRVTEILNTAAKAVKLLSKTLPVRAVIQTALSSTPGKSGMVSISNKLPGDRTDQSDPAFFVFSETVDHRALFPQVSVVVSHGGIGTLQAALTSGKPVLSMCCLPNSDQSFWADLASRRKLGPKYFWVKELSVKKMTQGIEDAILNLEEYTHNAEYIAKSMALEDGIGSAMAILEKELVTGLSKNDS